MEPNTSFNLNRLLRNTDLFLALGLLGTLIVMILPMPPLLMDLLLVLSLTMSIAILLVSVYASRPLDFSVFPTLLLFSTLARLSLNVASTRLVLLHGHEGTAAAGHIIETFGNLVVGGSYIVGTVIFILLIIINFVVITKGSGRVAEVAARFILDSMPGKQMSIDADLNAGHINEEQARERRRKIEQEADFYGAMDGASKFVRGDAIAGVLIRD
jgi:flagellar biosynthesis protein FlhA